MWANETNKHRKKSLMAGITCPYLGIKDDSETALAYPSQWNCCFRGGSPVALEVEHQRKYCLSTAYVGCPIYTETSKSGRVPDFRQMQGSTIEKQDQPLQGRVVQTRNISSKKVIISVVLLLCLLVIVFGAVWGKQFWNNWDERIALANLFRESASETPIIPTVIINVSSTIAKTEHTFTPRVVLVSPQVISQTPKKSLTNTSTVKPSSTIRIEVTETPAETRTPVTTRACGVPAGWVQYIIQVGDTLSRLSRVIRCIFEFEDVTSNRETLERNQAFGDHKR